MLWLPTSRGAGSEPKEPTDVAMSSPSSEVAIVLFSDDGSSSQLLFEAFDDVSCASEALHPTSQDPLSFTMDPGGADPFLRRGSGRGGPRSCSKSNVEFVF